MKSPPSSLLAFNMGAFLVALVVGTLAGCEHSQPFSVPEREPLGPFPAEGGRTRLTFNTGEDRDPSVHGDLLVFSRLEAGRTDRDRCIAFMPVEGGTLTRVSCPRGSVVDDSTQAWLQPTVSPDGSRIAYVLEISDAMLQTLAPSRRHLMIAPIDRPEEGVLSNPVPVISVPGGTVTDFRDLRWVGPGTLRFIGGQGFVNTLTLDTSFVSLGLFDLSVEDLSVVQVLGVPDPITYTAAPDGGVWFIPQSDSTSIYHTAPGAATPRVLITMSGTMRHMTAVGEFAVVVMTSTIAWIDLRQLKLRGILWAGDLPRHVAAVPGSQRIVAEIVRGPGADLWLIETP